MQKLKDSGFQVLLDEYPKISCDPEDNAGGLTASPCVVAFSKLTPTSGLKEGEIKYFSVEVYDERVAEIKSYFEELFDKYPATTNEPQPIAFLRQWQSKGFGGDLTYHAPAKMLLIHRRAKFILDEHREINKASLLLTDPQKYQAAELIEKVKEGLATYLTRNTSHLSSWSGVFDRSRGHWRAKVYQKALISPTLTLEQQAIVVYSIFASGDGPTLIGDIQKKLIPKRETQFLVNQLKQMIKSFYKTDSEEPTLSVNNINDIIGKIINTANSPSLFYSYTDKSPNIEEIKPSLFEKPTTRCNIFGLG